jgi:predicted Zn finger-like uncharacterized protein
MPLKIQCPNCQKSLQVPDAAIGKKGKCPSCQHIWMIAQPASVKGAAPQKNPTSASAPAAFISSSLLDELLNDQDVAATKSAMADGVEVTSGNYEIVGVWCDDTRLVVAPGGRQFPPYCVKTGRPCSGKAKHLELTWISFIDAIAQKNYKKISLDIPIDPRWLKRHQWFEMVGKVMFIGGIVLGVLGLVLGLYIVMNLGDISKNVIGQWGTYMIIASMICVAGKTIRGILSANILTVHKMKDGYTWLNGACYDFLDRLPEWHG